MRNGYVKDSSFDRDGGYPYTALNYLVLMVPATPNSNIIQAWDVADDSGALLIGLATHGICKFKHVLVKNNRKGRFKSKELTDAGHFKHQAGPRVFKRPISITLYTSKGNQIRMVNKTVAKLLFLIRAVPLGPS